MKGGRVIDIGEGRKAFAVCVNRRVRFTVVSGEGNTVEIEAEMSIPQAQQLIEKLKFRLDMSRSGIKCDPIDIAAMILSLGGEEVQVA